MMKKFYIFLIIMVLVFMASGCGKGAEKTELGMTEMPSMTDGPVSTTVVTPTTAPTASITLSVTLAVTPTNTPMPTNSPMPTLTPAPTEEPRDEYGMTRQQRNSFSMLYYLAITAEKIRTSKDNRLMLDDIYTMLLNDIDPSAIDETTQNHLNSLRDVIKAYINTSYKRERLQYMYNQEKAASIKSAVPNPLAVLSLNQAVDWKKMAGAVTYTVVDSYTRYKSANETANQSFLISGWELDDEERTNIANNRERAFNYMVTIVNQYALDGKLTLNEEAINDFVEICAIESVYEKIRRLTSSEKKYKLLGDYWLELAECYYEVGQFQNCLECVDKYNGLTIEIYRADQNLVRILPKAIVAAQNVYTGQEYVEYIKMYADTIRDNTNDKEWSMRYFVAQVYLDLFAKTNDKTYLTDAYNIIFDNVTILLDGQRNINKTYLESLADIKAIEPDYRFMTAAEKKEAEREYKAEQKRVKKYNNELKKKRKTELPTLYEPLVLNCDLLYALAEELDISAKMQKEIQAILQTETNGIFISKPINDRYSFANKNKDYNISLEKTEIIIPTELLLDGTKIVVTVIDDDKSTVCDDCIIEKVERKGKSIDRFSTVVTSKKMKSYKWTKNTKVSVVIDDGYGIVLNFKFRVSEFKDRLGPLSDKVVFEKE